MDELASDMEAKIQRQMVGGPVQWVYNKVSQEESKTKDLQEKVCLVAFVTEFNRVCLQIVRTGKTLRVTGEEQAFVEYCG